MKISDEIIFAETEKAVIDANSRINFEQERECHKSDEEFIWETKEIVRKKLWYNGIWIWWHNRSWAWRAKVKPCVSYGNMLVIILFSVGWIEWLMHHKYCDTTNFRLLKFCWGIIHCTTLYTCWIEPTEQHTTLQIIKIPHTEKLHFCREQYAFG